MSDEEQRVPLIEERVRIDKRLVDSGVVRISTSVDTNTEVISAALMHEEVEIERVPMELEVERVPDVREDGDILVIPVVEERAFVVKRLVLVEELHVRRKTVQQTAEISVDVRSTQVHVHREGSAADPVQSRLETGDDK